MRQYRLEGHDGPLRLSEEHAELIGATEWTEATAPTKSANKAAWVAWAVANGADPALAEASTRTDLIAEYGE